ncbi:hypothetical protein BDW42DRAFT_182160 [Aspergillus taichungensis]|uniref:Uncharacterized protein n=1 Tax=Aspergillus taichungensis TaxID=482145 RepID=A0A2J5HCT0_9EURO|nr:hypothetical protein BDW42DRAFT_182160 [Aspergillus taichungensis]
MTYFIFSLATDWHASCVSFRSRIRSGRDGGFFGMSPGGLVGWRRKWSSPRLLSHLSVESDIARPLTSIPYRTNARGQYSNHARHFRSLVSHSFMIFEVKNIANIKAFGLCPISPSCCVRSSDGPVRVKVGRYIPVCLADTSTIVKHAVMRHCRACVIVNKQIQTYIFCQQ